MKKNSSEGPKNDIPFQNEILRTPSILDTGWKIGNLNTAPSNLDNPDSRYSFINS
jgi:hypothetical protein